MASTGTYYDENEPRSRARTALDLVSGGGLGSPHTPPPEPSLNDALTSQEARYGPSGSKSLSGIALRAFLLGMTLVLSATISSIIFLQTDSPSWRAPLFITFLCIFHFLEFWTTAEYNPSTASISSFLFSSNGSAYTFANVAALLECTLTSLVFPTRHWLPPTASRALTLLGLFLLVVMQTVRSTAMIQAGRNFNHIVAHHKTASHQLVTDGIYGIWRHPSYFGYYWWGLGTQLMMGNGFCFVGYAVVLWRFFSARIRGEEANLIRFFGDEYVQYRKRTWIGIPFI